jgi:hypothetical protein
MPPDRGLIMVDLRTLFLTERRKHKDACPISHQLGIESGESHRYIPLKYISAARLWSSFASSHSAFPLFLSLFTRRVSPRARALWICKNKFTLFLATRQAFALSSPASLRVSDAGRVDSDVPSRTGSASWPGTDDGASWLNGSDDTARPGGAGDEP